MAPQANAGAMPYVGIASFLKAPICTDLAQLAADVAVIGIPFDEGTMNRPGTRFGPRALREQSSLYEQYVPGEGYYDSDAGEIGIIQIDTHADVFTFYESDLTHGSPMINIANHCPNVTKFVQIGMRGVMLGERDYTDSVQRGNVIITSDEVRRHGPDWVLDQIPAMPYYVTFDIDSMDPSIAPGAGTPEPGGLMYWQARDLLRGVAGKAPVVGFDLVEVNPLYDSGGTTALLATRLIIDFLGAIFAAREGGA